MGVLPPGGALRHLVVDAMNVVGSRPTGWWRDRGGALRTLAGRLRRLATGSGWDVTVVIDGRPVDGLPAGADGNLRVLYAARAGRNAADNRIVRFVRAHDDPSFLEVVTSDRRLAERARACGATVRGATWLLELLDELDG